MLRLQKTSERQLQPNSFNFHRLLNCNNHAFYLLHFHQVCVCSAHCSSNLSACYHCTHCPSLYYQSLWCWGWSKKWIACG